MNLPTLTEEILAEFRDEFPGLGTFEHNRVVLEAFLIDTIKKVLDRVERDRIPNDCSCKERWTYGVVHCKNVPCYWPPRIIPEV